MSPGPGYFPIQCDHCGRELRNMACIKCSSPGRSLASPKKHEKTNKKGFRQYSLLTTKTPPTSPVKTRSPWNMGVSTPSISALIRHVKFEDNDGGKLRLLNGKDNIGIIDPSVKNGHHRPFAKRVKEDETFTVLTEFKWATHEWKTSDIPCNRDTTETTLFRSLCIYFSQFLNAMEECPNSKACLCGGPESSVTWQKVVILSYDLYDTNGSFKIKVKAGTGA